jgi:hypothetical protein
MRKKTKMANICRSLRTKIFFSPVLKSPTHIEFTDVKKMGRKSHTWAPLSLPLSVFMQKLGTRTQYTVQESSEITYSALQPKPPHIAAGLQSRFVLGLG